MFKGVIITKKRLLVIGIAALLTLVGISGCLENKSIESPGDDNWKTQGDGETDLNEDNNESEIEDSESNEHNDTQSNEEEDTESDENETESTEEPPDEGEEPPEEPPEEPKYTLTVEIVGSGSVIKNPDQVTYTDSTVVELTAVPNSNWIFSYWAGDITSSNNPETITIDGNKTVIAAFEEEPEPFIIQEAIDNAEDGDTIFVPSGTYYESLQINSKSITLIGEDKGTTTIEGSIHLIYADDTSISGFTIRGSAGHGITIKYSNHISISDNIILNWGVGMGLYNSDNNTITGNVVLNCGDGIYFSYSGINIVTLNTVGSSNWYGINVRDLSDNNLFHHNNFINNPKEFRDYCSNIWDDGIEGNYWDDYNGTDGDGDGIGDTSYLIIEGNEDRYPLMNEV